MYTLQIVHRKELKKRIILVRKTKEERRERKMNAIHETVKEIFSSYRQYKPTSIVLTQSKMFCNLRYTIR